VSSVISDVRVPLFTQDAVTRLLQWCVPDGTVIARDDLVAEIETEKANVEVYAPASGTLRQVVTVGDDVQIGQLLAHIETSS